MTKQLRAETSVIRPYGDTTGDGMVQLSFTLPVPSISKEESVVAEEAAKQLAHKMGIDPVMVAHIRAIGPDFSFFIVYGPVAHLVDLGQIQPPEREYPLLSAKEINLAIRQVLHRRMVVLGATIGTDAHTVGIDAVLNAKGHAGEKGLESYREMAIVNLGGQVPIPELVARAQAERADAVLVSQVVTQKDVHLSNVRELAAAFEAAYSRPDERPVLVAGGPRFDARSADDLGVDRVFDKATSIRDVASYLVFAVSRRCGQPA
jgi:beta-lysine 5,6-aminomutase beta subunit